MPASWTTEEQIDFLKAELPRYLAAQREHRASRFMKDLAECWFRKWSECDILFPEHKNEPLTNDDSKKLGAAIEKRKKVRQDTSQKGTLAYPNYRHSNCKI